MLNVVPTLSADVRYYRGLTADFLLLNASPTSKGGNQRQEGNTKEGSDLRSWAVPPLPRYQLKKLSFRRRESQ